MVDAGLYRRALPAHLRAQADDGIDFTALRGNAVGVLGAGASAFDNVAEALDAGANPVHLFCRRDLLQTIQPPAVSRFTDSFAISAIWTMNGDGVLCSTLGLAESFTQDAYDRCTSYPHFEIRTSKPWLDATVEEGRAVLTTPEGDYLICGTGGDMDVALRPELAAFSEHIATWADRYTPPQDEEEERLGRYPYLGPDYAFLEKTPGAARYLKDIYCFGIGAWMSFGMSGASISNVCCRLQTRRRVTRGKLEHHLEGLQAYDTSQVKLRNCRLEDVVQDPIVVSVAGSHMREARGGIDRWVEILLLSFNSVVVFRQDDVKTLVIIFAPRSRGALSALRKKEQIATSTDSGPRGQSSNRNMQSIVQAIIGWKNTGIPGPFLVAAPAVDAREAGLSFEQTATPLCCVKCTTH